MVHAATIDLRKQKGDADAELHMQATIDEAARRRLGMDLGAAVTGTIPIKVVGHVGDNANDDGMSVEADLTPVKIDNLLPGWVKPAGKACARHLCHDENRQNSSLRRFEHRRLGRDGARLGRI